MNKEILNVKYSKGEEIFNMVTHIVGSTVGIAALTLGIIISSINFNGYSLASSIAFGIAIILVYVISSIYHGLKPNTTGKKVFRILDHAMIFVLIAGTYTPFALCLLREYNLVIGWTMFGVVWLLALIGIIFSAISIEKFKLIFTLCYHFIGWCIVFKIDVLFKLLTPLGFIIVSVGGILYLIGSLIYIIGKEKKWLHSVMHIFMVLGTSAHIVSVLLFVL